MVKKLTDALDELFIKQGLSLVESLEVMASYRKDRKLCRVAEFLLDGLRKGNEFANLLKGCPDLKCDSVFLSFVLLAEKTGNLTETIAFLKKRSDRRYQGHVKIVEAAVYPLFVIVLAVGAGAFLLKYAGGWIGRYFWNWRAGAVLCKRCCIFCGEGNFEGRQAGRGFLCCGFTCKKRAFNCICSRLRSSDCWSKFKIGRKLFGSKNKA